MFLMLGLLSIEKLFQFDCCFGHLNKALIDQKHVYVYFFFGTGWMRGFFLNYSSKQLRSFYTRLGYSVLILLISKNSYRPSTIYEQCWKQFSY